MKPTSRRTYQAKQFQQLPHDADVEESLIASALLGNALEIVETVTPNDFYVDKHKTILGGIAELVANHVPIDLVTVKNHLTQKVQLERCGGAAFLAELIDAVPVAVNVPHYCSILKDLSKRRKVISQSNALAKKAFDGDNDLSEAVARMFRDIDAEGTDDENAVSFKDLALSRPELWESLKDKGFPGVPTGFPTIDAITGGWQNAELVVLAGRPSMGKSSLAMAFAEGAASDGFPVAVVSLEMSPGNLFDRSTAKHAKINTQTFRMGGFTDNDWSKLLNTMEAFSDLPIIINEKPLKNCSEIVRWIRRRHKEDGTKLVIIDYLQLICGDQTFQRKDLEIGDITRRLKELAMELDMPILLLSQLNRKLEDRENKRPRLADLRDSGAIEQDADLVLLLYRDEVYNSSTDNKKAAELNFAKHRNGPGGFIELFWDGWRCAFEEAER